MVKDLEKEKELAAKKAVKLILDGQIVGLGTGSTAAYAVKEIGALVKAGLNIRAIPTSNKTAELARSLNIPLIDIDSVDYIDITIDGADEFTADMILIKGGGGALLREKVIASMTKKEIIIVDSSKRSGTLGKFKLPIEVIPFSCNYVLRQLNKINGLGTERKDGDMPFITDNGNHILDCNFGLITNPVYLSDRLNEIEGIAGHGLFLKLTSKIIMGLNDSIIVYE